MKAQPVHTGSDPSTSTEPRKTRPRLLPDALAADFLLDRAIRSVIGKRNRAVAVVVEVPDPTYISPIADSLRRRLPLGSGYVDDGDATEHRQRLSPRPLVEFRRDGSAQNHNPATGNRTVATAIGAGRSVIGVSQSPERYLPADLLRIADARLAVPGVDQAVIAQIIAARTGRSAKGLPSDADCRLLSLNDVCLALPPGSGPRDCVARLRRIIAAKASAARGEGPFLADLHGLDAARQWGEALARDLAEFRRGTLDWSAVDRGALLVGPPGTGKTVFARALARTCDCPLVTGSLAEWQRAGHLGQLLHAMRASFDQARNLAPCILFVDEVDAFGDRQSFVHDYRDYSIQVVNAFLEELDGVQGRPGVVVVAACNNDSGIDPAIKRSGRLDRVIHVPLPDAQALGAILRYHLGSDLAGEDLRLAALAAQGGTGADAERWVRGARRGARQAGRSLTMRDLLGEIAGLRSALRPESRGRAAVHEAGHGVATLAGGLDKVERISIVGNETTVGWTATRGDHLGMLTRSNWRSRLVSALAGRAAEEVILGEPSDGCGGGPDSDLAVATGLAAMMVGSLGMGPAGRGEIVWCSAPDPRAASRLLSQDPDLRDRVARLLDEAYAEALSLVRQHRRVLERTADLLLSRSFVEGPELERLARHVAPGVGDDRRARTRSGDSAMYEFTMQYRLPEPGPEPSSYRDALLEEGCEDVRLGLGEPRCITLIFSPEAPSAYDAVRSAIETVGRVLPGAEFISIVPGRLAGGISLLFGTSGLAIPRARSFCEPASLRIDPSSNEKAASPIAVLDFEASCLPQPGSFPIEVGIAFVANGHSRAWLIRPPERWLEHGVWDTAAEKLHGVSRDVLLAEGLPVDEAGAELARAAAGHLVLSDAVIADSFWLRKLYAGSPPFELERVSGVASEATRAAGVAARNKAIGNAVDEAHRRFPREHRAEPDARRLAEILRILKGFG